MISDAQGCQIVRAGSFMLGSRGIRHERLVGSDIERMLPVAALGQPEADQVRTLSKQSGRDQRAPLTAAGAPAANHGRAGEAGVLGDLVEVQDVLRAIRVRAKVEVSRIRAGCVLMESDRAPERSAPCGRSEATRPKTGLEPFSARWNQVSSTRAETLHLGMDPSDSKPV